ncbi:MAG: tetratricopeptide repeat protein [Crocinitomicaceae bacterium]|nr:tetratricopeptide repeat protein [Crocinitomicaceae bacterium]
MLKTKAFYDNLKSIIFFLSFSFSSLIFAQADNYQRYKEGLEGKSGVERLKYAEERVTDLFSSSPILAEKILKDAIRDANIQQDTLFLINFHRTLGGLQHHLAQFESATRNLNLSISLAKKARKPLELAKSKINLSSVFLYTRQYDLAIDYLNESIEVFKETDDKKTLGIAYSNLANMYGEKGDLSKAIEYGKISINVQQEAGDTKNLAISHMNLGSVYSRQSKFNEASVELNRASELFSSLNVKLELIFLYLEYSKMYQRQEAYSEASAFGNLALEMARNENSLDFQIKAFNQLGLIDYQQQKYESSLEYLKSQMILQDSLYKSLHAKQIRETSAVYGVFEAENKAQILRSEVEREKSLFWLIFIVALCILILLCGMVFLWFRLRAKNKVLFEQSKKNIAPIKTQENLNQEEHEKYRALYESIIEQFEEKKIYLDSTLTMGVLSDIVNSNSNYVSKSINAFFGSNFNSLINYYRVNEAKRLIEKGALDTYTMESIASKCGFTSLSVFNRSFKKETGITPTYFNKSILACMPDN